MLYFLISNGPDPQEAPSPQAPHGSVVGRKIEHLEWVVFKITLLFGLAIFGAHEVSVRFNHLWVGLQDPDEEDDSESSEGQGSDPIPQLQSLESKQSYTLDTGHDLSAIARDRYGNSHYAAIVKLYNEIGDGEERLPGRNVRTPDLRIILAYEGLTVICESEIEQLLEARAKFLDIEKDIRAMLENRRKEWVTLPDAIKRQLKLSANLIDGVRLGFSNLGGQAKTPSNVVAQLRRLSTGLRTLSSKPIDTWGYYLDMIHKRFASALTNSIHWARNDFRVNDSCTGRVKH